MIILPFQIYSSICVNNMALIIIVLDYYIKVLNNLGVYKSFFDLEDKYY